MSTVDNRLPWDKPQYGRTGPIFSVASNGPNTVSVVYRTNSLVAFSAEEISSLLDHNPSHGVTEHGQLVLFMACAVLPEARLSQIANMAPQIRIGHLGGQHAIFGFRDESTGSKRCLSFCFYIFMAVCIDDISAAQWYVASSRDCAKWKVESVFLLNSMTWWAWISVFGRHPSGTNCSCADAAQCFRK
ncbi:hypothetical protein FE257_004337 [Aspergillus nanangensis]|uniref:Uncharacterized protein n=1 Tax=Aspergillus nanangensis TaxID=2582783 RepID=A0AAD4CAS8_ASPNN|nr:hypothetical protein FE257_004337 [Aspergillus nanangensis]